MPTDLLTVWQGREVWRSLDTDSYATALRRIHQVAATVEADFEQMRCSIGCAIDPMLVALPDPVVSTPWSPGAPQPPTPLPPSRRRTIGDVYDRFIADPKHQWSKRTQIAHATTRKWVVEVFGEDKALTDISREECRDFVALLREMPKNAHQRFPDMTIKEVVAAAKAKGEGRLISTANLNAYVNRFGGVMNWAINEGYLNRNPLKGLKLPDPVKKRDKRNPFSPEQLRRIFDAPIYTGCRDDANGYAIPGDQRPRRARFWVPLIALFSGLRLNEICQLEVSDVREIDGVPCFSVASGVSVSGDEKRLKTNASERVVPIHDELIRCGFLAFAASQRLCGESNLFPELPFGHLGYRSTTISRWFTRFLENAEAAAPLTCFHSFRHNFRDGLREAKIGRDLALLLGGWTSDGKGTAVADNYGSGYQPRALAEGLNAVRFPALNLDHLAVLKP